MNHVNLRLAVTLGLLLDGRKTAISRGYRPNLSLKPSPDEFSLCEVTLLEGEIRPGDEAYAEMLVVTEEKNVHCFADGKDFFLFEGAKRVGQATILRSISSENPKT